MPWRFLTTILLTAIPLALLGFLVRWAQVKAKAIESASGRRHGYRSASDMISATAVIPARLSSRRFPRKPSPLVGESSLIVHLVRSVLQSGLFERVVVTSPDQEILDAVQGLGVVTCALSVNSAAVRSGF